MTPASFKAWRERLYGPRGVKAAAEALGCSRTSIHAWETGKHKVQRYIALACTALSEDLPPEGWDNDAVEACLRAKMPDWESL
jgi:DNA-binding XRE family transcriptional regulator